MAVVPISLGRFFFNLQFLKNSYQIEKSTFVRYSRIRYYKILEVNI